MAEPADAFVQRLDAVRQRLARLATTSPPSTLTDPDPRTGERWDWGQVWAHVVEFPAYWMEEVLKVIAEGDLTPAGRVQSDPARLEAIERDRAVSSRELWTRAGPDLDRLRDLTARLTPDDWSLRGVHSTLGEMPMPRIFDEFLVGHLEAHADQLDGLVRAAGRDAPEDGA